MIVKMFLVGLVLTIKTNKKSFPSDHSGSSYGRLKFQKLKKIVQKNLFFHIYGISIEDNGKNPTDFQSRRNNKEIN